jgi:SDR family mycofactocin-dependent oxidoreductase
MGRLDGKVAFITGAGRGQGRSHAIRLSQEGADIVAVDICQDIDGLGYEMANATDLDETARLVEESGRKVVARVADVRDADALAAAVEEGRSALGPIDIVCANAGISDYARAWEFSLSQWQNILDVNLTGVWNTVRVVVPGMIEAGNGGSIILTGSLAALKGIPGTAPYTAAKFGVRGLMETLAHELGEYRIRVNAIHPTNVNTRMIHNPTIYRLFVPDAVGEVTPEAFREVSAAMNILPVPWAEPTDISDAVLFLASDESRIITGVSLPVDAGAKIK